MTCLSTPPLKFLTLTETYYFAYLLLTVLSSNALRVQKVEALLDIWHGYQQSAVDSAIDGEPAFAPANGPKGGHFEL